MRVQVRSKYVRDRSSPFSAQYLFAYRVRITNGSALKVQLCTHHWTVTDAYDHVQDARGLGVTGEQPIIRLGSSFEYTSACPLQAPYGSMEGEFEMIFCDDPSSSLFPGRVGVFGLNTAEDS
eukprot:TRINITY_DN25010_c0_g1_i1.p1 TRINITY_DN25010_c0_g1~~TRINITY_DN25010_c0_g1_i1.p1  ORF type:complete len:122 (-),score=15.20 TRINITY_DN25010_c0_g1_i1:510-875(-)